MVVACHPNPKKAETEHAWGILAGYNLSAGELWVKLKDPASKVESN